MEGVPNWNLFIYDHKGIKYGLKIILKKSKIPKG